MFGNQDEANTTIWLRSINFITNIEDKTKFWHRVYCVEPGQNYGNSTSFLTMGRIKDANTWLDQWSVFLGFCSGDGNGGFVFNPFTNKIQVVGGKWAETGTVWTDEIVLKSQLTSTTYCADNSLITEAIFN